jgi:hypothetical protein
VAKRAQVSLNVPDAVVLEASAVVDKKIDNAVDNAVATAGKAVDDLQERLRNKFKGL